MVFRHELLLAFNSEHLGFDEFHFHMMDHISRLSINFVQLEQTGDDRANAFPVVTGGNAEA